MFSNFFHNWERRLASATTDRVVRPFDWGLDWLELDRAEARLQHQPLEAFQAYTRRMMADSAKFYAVAPASGYEFEAAHWLRFESALVTPHAANNIVHARYFPAERRGRRRDTVRFAGSGAGENSASRHLAGTANGNGNGNGRPGAAGAAGRASRPEIRHAGGDGPASRAAVVVLPQWNADAEGHVGLSRLLAKFGMSALRLSLPYHDFRMPPELHRADYIVSANVGRTLQVCRQAVLDARRAVHWLAARGYERIGILGTSLGSCLSMLTAAHEPLLRAAALNHVSPFFADVVWEGLSTEHVRAGLDGHVSLDDLRELWLPISPQPHLARLRATRTLLVYAKYDLTFPVALSQRLVHDFRALDLPHEVAVLPCGHYSTGMSPFKWLDGYLLTKFLRSSLRVG